MLLAKSITEEVARQLITVLSTELSIAPDQIVEAMRDRASVNDVVMRTVSVIFSRMMDMPCFSHTLDHVGERICTPFLNDFIKAWINLFSHSLKARLEWRTLTGLSVRLYSPTRWWSKFEVVHKLHNMFGDVPEFLHNSELPQTTTGKLLRIIDDQPSCRKLKMELAVKLDTMEPFIKVVAYQRLSALYNHISS